MPSTPEVNEEVKTTTSSSIDITDTPTKKMKSQSLPRESDPKSMQMFAKTEIITKTPQKTTIYVNKNISKSHDFEKPQVTSSVTVSGSSVTQIKPKQEDTGLIKRFWNRNHDSSKKKSETEEDDRGCEVMEHKSILQVNTTESEVTTTVKRPKSGAASRQRIVPKDIEIIEDVKEVTKPIPMARTSYMKREDLSPPKTNWHELSKTPKIVLSPLQQKCREMIEEESPKKGVAKSKSFRTYEPSNLMSSNLPSLPNLVQANSEESIAFSSLEEKIKFEINDYNLVKRSPLVDESTNIKKKNIVLKGAEEMPMTSASISQIEENIDKLMKSGVTTMLKNANSLDKDDSSSSPSDSSPGSPRYTEDPDEVIFREKRVSTVLEQFEAKSVVVKIIEKKPEMKPPKPPTALRVSTRTSSEKSDSPSSPTKVKEPQQQTGAVFEESEPRKAQVEDDRKIILQRRTSVSEERLKFERRISAGDEYKFERKKSQSDDGLDVKRASPDNEEVQLRKKSNEDGRDETPELMKVFARRSLKIHVDDEEKIHEELAKMKKLTGNVDSDKENQSSSEEKLDKVAANVTNNNSATLIKDKDENVIEPPPEKKPALVTPKPFGTPNRFSNVANYRNTQSFVEVRKNLQAKNNNNNTNGGEKPATATAPSQKNDTNLKNNNNNRHTVAITTPAPNTTELEDETEFKGILQRRAEWEKRAKEGFK